MKQLQRFAFRLILACFGSSMQAAAPVTEDVISQILARWDKDEHPDLKAVVVRRSGAVVAERYYNGAGPGTLHDIRSAGKSVTSLLIGAAIDRRRIHGTGDPVSRYLPEAKSKPAGAVSIENLLTMRSGLDANDQDPSSPGNEDRLDESSDPLGFALAVARREAPGSRYRYNSLTAYLAGIVLEKAVGRRVDEFARDVLFQPLGITEWRWRRDVSGHTKGQGNLFLTARDFGKLGQVVLGLGVYDGRRVLSEQWITASLMPRVAIRDVDPYANSYGYFWYSKAHQIGQEQVLVCFASGNGGNKIYIVPSRVLVVAITSSAYGRSYGQRRSEAILRALLAVIEPSGQPGTATP